MIRRLMLAALPLLAACQSPEPERAWPARSALPPPGLAATGCAAHAEAFGPLLGRPEAEVRAALGAMAGIRTVRAGGPGAAMTRDYRPDRATILLRDGRAERIDCG